MVDSGILITSFLSLYTQNIFIAPGTLLSRVKIVIHINQQITHYYPRWNIYRLILKTLDLTK